MVFGPALDEIERRDRATFGPTSFRDYVAEQGLDPTGGTPRYISVNSLHQLDDELRGADTMVLRMGSAPDGTGTQFLLARADASVDEFFLLDRDAFGDAEPKRFEPAVDREATIAFELLPQLSETSLVNLGLASGVLSEALDLDTDGALMPPATGRSTFTFDVQPHSSIPETFEHRRGQVEIDTLFAERRDGQRVLFVIEAKTGTSTSSLAKHKLVYPMLAIAEDVPDEFDIVPVYIRASQEGREMTYRVAECEMSDPRERQLAVDEIGVRRGTVLRLGFGD